MKKCQAWRVQEMARTRPVELKGARSFKSLVLHETDRLSKEAQHSLRRTMEKYTAACRLVLICNNVSKVGQPICMLRIVWEQSASQCRVQDSSVFMCSIVCELAAVVSLRLDARQGCLLPCAHEAPEWHQQVHSVREMSLFVVAGCQRWAQLSLTVSLGVLQPLSPHFGWLKMH